MKISARIEDGNAILSLTTISSRSKLKVNDAERLADDLERFLTNPDAEAINRHYRLVPHETGLSLQTIQGRFDLPWRHITTVVNGLRADV
ncbi:hypothetical protein [Ruegeria arenilitoris]|uniref:hypothetical protein n=1 Tax=Ruegeria arenilitoris TaxID=1173585 RepID=UPI00147C6578|nr:hypothetical protein [Ruegeria arenilitoris]